MASGECTIEWHVDELKISHHDFNVVESVIKQLEAEFGKVRKYLGMVIII
jgi:hypothetical protein